MGGTQGQPCSHRLTPRAASELMDGITLLCDQVHWSKRAHDFVKASMNKRPRMVMALAGHLAVVDIALWVAQKVDLPPERPGGVASPDARVGLSAASILSVERRDAVWKAVEPIAPIRKVAVGASFVELHRVVEIQSHHLRWVHLLDRRTAHALATISPTLAGVRWTSSTTT